MLESLKYKLTHNWNFTRVLRFGLAFVVVFEAVKNHDWLFGLLGGILIVQSVLNIGCCSAQTYYSSKKNDDSGNEQVIYEEIKNKN